MKILPALSIVTLAACKASPAAPPEKLSFSEVDSAPRPDPMATVSAYLDATTRGDLDAAAELVVDDSLFFESGGSEGTWSHYRHHHLGPEVAMFDAFQLSKGEPKVTASADSSVVVIALPIEYDILLKDQRSISSLGTTTFALVLKGDRYFIEQIHWSSRPRPRPTEPASKEGADATYAAARPVFERHCGKCHSRAERGGNKDALKHFDMTSYPFRGHHADAIAPSIASAMGLDGSEATMPKGKAAGSVSDQDLAAIRAWVDAVGGAKKSDTSDHGEHAH